MKRNPLFIENSYYSWYWKVRLHEIRQLTVTTNLVNINFSVTHTASR